MNLRTTFVLIGNTAGLFLVMAVLMLSIGDQFPFSHFPMYATLPESTFCIRVTDADGKLMPVQLAFGVQSSILKKQMVRELKEQKDNGRMKLVSAPPPDIARECGRRVLEWMLDHRPAFDPALVGKAVKLEQVTYTARKGAVKEKVDVLAEGFVKHSRPAP